MSNDTQREAEKGGDFANQALRALLGLAQPTRGRLYNVAGDYQTGLFPGLVDLLKPLLEQPRTLTPELVSGLKANAASEANQAFDSRIREVRERSTVGAGSRSGSTLASENRLAGDLGESIAGANRQLDVAAATQGLTDIGTVASLISQLLSQEAAIRQIPIGAHLGAAGAIAQAPSIGTGIGSLFSGLTSLGSAALLGGKSGK
jgi:hypothetical protein